MRLNLYFFIDLKNEPNIKEIIHTFNRFLFAFGRFPAIIELRIVPIGNVPSFVRLRDIISPFELYNKLNLGNARDLVCVHFLVTLNVLLGGDKMISKDTMSEFFHNSSMQALSKSDDAILIKFDTLNKLNKSLNNLLMAEALAFDTERVSRMTAINKLNKSLNNLLTAEARAFDTERVSRMTTINKLNKSLNNLLTAEARAFDTERVSRMTSFF